jgi:ADP-heptose:LPS heptosyltransferase
MTPINPSRVSLRIGKTDPPPTNKLLINFNSEASSRRMPVDKAIHISTLLLNTFKKLNLSFIGSPKERAFIELIISGLDNSARVENLAGQTTLKELAGLMAAGTALLTTDSGPAHLANSVGTPTIVLFGAGNEDNTAPYNKQHLTVIRYGKLPCEPCVKNTCKLYGIPKCLEMIDELQIINALHLLIQE